MTITRESLRTAVVLAKFFLLTVFISLVIRIGLSLVLPHHWAAFGQLVGTFAFGLCFSLPRTRGGLPAIVDAEMPTPRFAPHTRGSTEYLLYYPGVQRVCPAHAGVYRDHSGPYVDQESLPRTRGGLPLAHTRPGEQGTFAPHTRGSTRTTLARPNPRTVCPAHAGVYRITFQPRASAACLPRTRGGLPEKYHPLRLHRRFAPHTRGSTLRLAYRRLQDGVCPAHAGVYPFLAGLALVGNSLPRTRGGLPNDENTISTAVLFAPHTRGSTV